jgi:hypothetical protein
LLSYKFLETKLQTQREREREREMDRVRIEEVQSTTKKQRIATHTHIKGLGLEVLSPSLPLYLGFLSNLP